MNSTTHSFSPVARRGNAAAFTLIELLVVIAVLALLFATAAPVAFGVLKASRMTSAGESLLGRLVEAQQMAIAQDTDVEVRIYEGNDTEFSGPPRWRAVQTFALRISSDAADATAEGAFQPAGTLLKLDSSVVISSDAKLSSLLNLKFVDDTSAAVNPGVGLTRHVAFRFHSDGSTDLTPGKSWFLTLVGQTSEPQDSPPPNYFTIQVDSSTGRLRSYRP